MPKPPRIILLASALLGVAVVATAAWRIFQGAVAQPPNVYMVGFESLALLAGVFAILVARGRFVEGAGLTLLSISGVVLVSSVISYSTARGKPLNDPDMVRDPFTAARIAVALAFGALAALTVLLRRPALSFKRLTIGIVWIALALAIAAPAVLPQARPFVASLHPIVRMMGAVFGFVLFCGFFSAGIHFLVRALEAGRLDSDPQASRADPRGA